MSDEFDPSFIWKLSAVPNLFWPQSVLARQNIPPASAEINDCYIIGEHPTDEWKGKANQIAVRNADGVWIYLQPARGRRAYVDALKKRLEFNGKKWLPETSGLPAGGLNGYVLKKQSDADYDVFWAINALGGGGAAGLGPIKLAATSENVTGIEPEGTCFLVLGNSFGSYYERGAVYERVGEAWVLRGSLSQTGIPQGGSSGQVLAKTSGTSFAVAWVDPEAAGGDITSVVAGTGLTGGGTSGDVTLNAAYGTSSTTACVGNDSRLSNDRTASGLRSATTTVSVSAATAPTSGQVLTATGGSAATWQDLPGGSPTGSAGGDLGGTYPNPTVAALHTGATKLTIGAIVDGEFLQRSGTTIASAAGTSAPQPVQVNGTLIGTRDAVDIVAGSGILVSGADDSGGNCVRVTVAASGSLGASAQSPYTIRSSTPSAYDDEFLGGSADLGVRGWSVYNVTNSVTMTRLGSINPWGASLANGEYNSDIQGSYLLLQVPRNKRVIVYRAFTPSTDGHVFIRAELTAGISLGNSFLAARTWLNNAGIPDMGAGTTLSTFAMIQADANNIRERFGRGDTTDTVISSADNLTSRDGRGFFYSSTNQYRFFATGCGGIHQAIPQTSASTGPTISSLAWIGIDILSADVAATTNLGSMFVIDYIRHYSGTGWIL